MALVLMATHGWGTLFVDPADLEAGVGLQSSFTNPADATAVTHYADDAGASPSTGPVTADANGRLMRWVEEGTYNQALPGGTVLEVQAVSGGTLASVETKVVVVQEAPLNVKDARFGAVLDGSTDDWNALAAARTLALTATKAEIYIPPGILLINSLHSYSPASGLRLFGAGPGRSTIKVGAGGSNPIANSGTAHVRASVEHLTIDCNGQNVKAFEMNSNLEPAASSTDFSIFDVEILDAWNTGLQLSRAVRPHVKKLRINGVRVNGTVAVGIWLFGGTHDADLEDIDIEGTGGHGLAIDAGTTGGVVGTTADEAYGNRIKGLHVKDAGGIGLLFEGGPRNVVEGVILDNCGTTGAPSVGQPACMLTSDQSGLTSDDNHIDGLTILNSPSTPLLIRNSSRNKIRAIVNGVGRGGSNNPAVFYYAWSGGTDKCEDNDVEILASDDGAGAYEWGVLHRGELTSSVKGNKTRGSFGRGSRAPTTLSSTNASAITIPFTGADANVVSVDAPITGTTHGQRGVKVPEQPNHGTALLVANRGYLLRVPPPERDVLMVKAAHAVSTAATNNDDCAYALWDETMTTILVASGATAGKLNAGGWQTVPLVYTLAAGTAYYLHFTCGAVGGTAATLLAHNLVSASIAYPFGQTFATGLEADVKNTMHPPTAPYGAIAAAAAATPLFALREL